jgi:hypothetical protein
VLKQCTAVLLHVNNYTYTVLDSQYAFFKEAIEAFPQRSDAERANSSLAIQAQYTEISSFPNNKDNISSRRYLAESESGIIIAIFVYFTHLGRV